jgi:tungstate transport system ATP-binding protein
MDNVSASASNLLPLQLLNVSYAAPSNNGLITILRDVSLFIAPGTRTIILGPNGAGKSVLLRVMHGILQPTAGTVQWSHSAPNAQAMVFQKPVMLKRSVIANIKFALTIRTKFNEKKSVDRAALETLERAGIAHLSHRQARRCSGGEQQRIALARAWALKPEIIFLDEPTASLDPSATTLIENTIQSIHATGTSVVMSSHDLGQARRLADKIIFIHQGRVEADCDADTFFNKPPSSTAQAFLKGQLLC